jgi:hypothetical protein
MVSGGLRQMNGSADSGKYGLQSRRTGFIRSGVEISAFFTAYCIEWKGRYRVIKIFNDGHGDLWLLTTTLAFCRFDLKPKPLRNISTGSPSESSIQLSWGYIPGR